MVYIRCVYVLIQRLLNQILRFEAGQLGNPARNQFISITFVFLHFICGFSPGVQEYKLQVHARSEHEHVLVELYLRYRRRGQRVADCNETQILDAIVRLSVGVLHLVNARL